MISLSVMSELHDNLSAIILDNAGSRETVFRGHVPRERLESCLLWHAARLNCALERVEVVADVGAADPCSPYSLHVRPESLHCVGEHLAPTRSGRTNLYV